MIYNFNSGSAAGTVTASYMGLRRLLANGITNPSINANVVCGNEPQFRRRWSRNTGRFDRTPGRNPYTRQLPMPGNVPIRFRGDSLGAGYTVLKTAVP